MGDTFEEVFYIDLLVCLLSCLVYCLTVLPIRLAAAESFNPVISNIFQIFPKMQILLPGHMPIPKHKSPLTNPQLIPILIKTN